MPAVAYPHIMRDADGHLRIEGAWYKVLVLLEEHLSRGSTVEDLVEAHEMLTLAQAHSLLAFYYDNKAELDEVLREREQRTDELMEAMAPPPALAKFKSLKQAKAQLNQ